MGAAAAEYAEAFWPERTAHQYLRLLEAVVGLGLAQLSDVDNRRLSDYVSFQDVPSYSIDEPNDVASALLELIRDHWRGERVHPTARIAKTAIVSEDCLVGRNCTIGDYALVRGGSVLKAGAVVGHACEIARSAIGPEARVAHKATIADAIVGARANLGALCALGALNLFQIELVVSAAMDPETVRSGVVIGDGTVLGANCVLGPRLWIGRRCIVYPNALLSSMEIPHDHVVKLPAARRVEIVPRT